jgi:hypothetical protein
LLSTFTKLLGLFGDFIHVVCAPTFGIDFPFDQFAFTGIGNKMEALLAFFPCRRFFLVFHGNFFHLGVQRDGSEADRSRGDHVFEKISAGQWTFHWLSFFMSALLSETA